MALSKTITTDYGIDVTYWMLAPLQVDKFSKTAYMRLYGFIDKETREKPFAKCLVPREYSIYPDKFDEVFNYTDNKNEREQAYDYIKITDEDFKDALDV